MYHHEACGLFPHISILQWLGASPTFCLLPCIFWESLLTSNKMVMSSCIYWFVLSIVEFCLQIFYWTCLHPYQRDEPIICFGETLFFFVILWMCYFLQCVTFLNWKIVFWNGGFLSLFLSMFIMKCFYFSSSLKNSFSEYF